MSLRRHSAVSVPTTSQIRAWFDLGAERAELVDSPSLRWWRHLASDTTSARTVRRSAEVYGNFQQNVLAFSSGGIKRREYKLNIECRLRSTTSPTNEQ